MKVDTPVDLTGTFAGDLHDVLRETVRQVRLPSTR
jgi:hypothetical protein